MIESYDNSGYGHKLYVGDKGITVSADNGYFAAGWTETTDDALLSIKSRSIGAGFVIQRNGDSYVDGFTINYSSDCVVRFDQSGIHYTCGGKTMDIPFT